MKNATINMLNLPFQSGTYFVDGNISQEINEFIIVNILFKSFLLLKESEHVQVVLKLDPDLKQSINVKLLIIKTTYRLLLKYYTKTYLYFRTSIQQKQRIK
ncbi:hypothetical protein V1477_014435 [Vespula maculifrons]|uniref:Uncharacterized protein n=1 Tax=Vespula maculifrons TaxID=7453 RepID=A0ABD2BL10_VESMC